MFIHSGCHTENPVLYPLYSFYLSYYDNSKKIKCAEIRTTKVNILFKVLCCVDKVHLKRMRKSLKVV